MCGGGGGAAPAASREGAHAHLGGTLGGAIPSLHSNKTDSKRAWAHVYNTVELRCKTEMDVFLHVPIVVRIHS